MTDIPAPNSTTQIKHVAVITCPSCEWTATDLPETRVQYQAHWKKNHTTLPEGNPMKRAPLLTTVSTLHCPETGCLWSTTDETVDDLEAAYQSHWDENHAPKPAVSSFPVGQVNKVDVSTYWVMTENLHGDAWVYRMQAGDEIVNLAVVTGNGSKWNIHFNLTNSKMTVGTLDEAMWKAVEYASSSDAYNRLGVMVFSKVTVRQP